MSLKDVEDHCKHFEELNLILISVIYIIMFTKNDWQMALRNIAMEIHWLLPKNFVVL